MCPSHFKGYNFLNPHLLSEHDHQIILDKIKAREILTIMNMWKMKINTMQIVMILMMMIINNSYFIFNILWKNSGGTALIACKKKMNLFSSVSLPRHV